MSKVNVENTVSAWHMHAWLMAGRTGIGAGTNKLKVSWILTISSPAAATRGKSTAMTRLENFTEARAPTLKRRISYSSSCSLLDSWSFFYLFLFARFAKSSR